MDHILDAKNKVLGRFASEIARLLQDKESPKFERHLSIGPKVIIKNVKELVVTVKKSEQKYYHRHTGYMGHLKSTKYSEAFKKNPAWVLRHAVMGMLPKNYLSDRRIKRLVIEE